MSTPALARGIPVQADVIDGTSTADGTIHAVPFSTSHVPCLGIHITFDADPGAYVFLLEGSLDGGSTFDIIGSTITGTTVNKTVVVAQVPFPLIRVSQTSKANDVDATINLCLA